MGPVLGLVVSVLAICWSRVAAHRRGHHGPDDDDEPWRGDGSGDEPRLPDGGSDGPVIDWRAFEREFAAYVGELERDADRILTPAR
jgi:hypothetical protein